MWPDHAQPSWSQQALLCAESVEHSQRHKSLGIHWPWTSQKQTATNANKKQMSARILDVGLTLLTLLLNGLWKPYQRPSWPIVNNSLLEKAKEKWFNKEMCPSVILRIPDRPLIAHSDLCASSFCCPLEAFGRLCDASRAWSRWVRLQLNHSCWKLNRELTTSTPPSHQHIYIYHSDENVAFAFPEEGGPNDPITWTIGKLHLHFLGLLPGSHGRQAKSGFQRQFFEVSSSKSAVPSQLLTACSPKRCC